MATVKELKEFLNRNYKDSDVIAYHLWEVDDVMMRGKDRDIEIDKETAARILEAVNRNKDASVGINWDVIDYHTDEELKK